MNPGVILDSLWGLMHTFCGDYEGDILKKTVFRFLFSMRDTVGGIYWEGGRQHKKKERGFGIMGKQKL